MLKHAEREFSQSGLCQMLPMLGMLLTLPDTALIVHGGLGCAGAGHQYEFQQHPPA